MAGRCALEGPDVSGARRHAWNQTEDGMFFTDSPSTEM